MPSLYCNEVFNQGPLFDFLTQHALNDKGLKRSDCPSGNSVGPRKKQAQPELMRPVTHTNMACGKYSLTTKSEIDTFRKLLARAIQNKQYIQSISECKSVICPMYADIDLKAPVATLLDATVQRIGTIMTRHLRKFFPSIDPSLLNCIVCVRNGASRKEKKNDDVNFKHGIHLYWPALMVNGDQMKEMRFPIANALQVEEWPEFGGATVDWNDALDAAVYNKGGLRVIGAPKATKCPDCMDGFSNCGTCRDNNNKHVMDERSYEFSMALTADGRRDEEREATLRKDVLQLVHLTTVRAPSETDPTPGYQVYESIMIDPAVTSGTGKRGLVRSTVEKKMEKVYNVVVTDPRILRVMRQHLIRHSPEYTSSVIKVRAWYPPPPSIKRSHTAVPASSARGTTPVVPMRLTGLSYHSSSKEYLPRFIVTLTGDGSRYCLNKGDSHGRNRVYMKVEEQLPTPVLFSHMHCHCNCNIVREKYKMQCSSFHSTPIQLTDKEHEVCLGGDSTTSAEPPPPQCASGSASAPAPGSTDESLLHPGTSPIDGSSVGDACNASRKRKAVSGPDHVASRKMNNVLAYLQRTGYFATNAPGASSGGSS